MRQVLGGLHDPAVAARAIARFRREADAAAHLRSAHTVDLYDFGVTEDETGRWWSEHHPSPALAPEAVTL
jgi:hypothetical protein